MSHRRALLSVVLVMNLIIAGLALVFFVTQPRPGEIDCIRRVQVWDSAPFISFDAEAWCGERSPSPPLSTPLPG